MKNLVYTMERHNAQVENGLRFRNLDGTLKTAGFVVTNGKVCVKVKSKQKAFELAETDLNVEETITDCHLTNYSN